MQESWNTAVLLKVLSPMSNPTSSLQDIFGSFTFLKMSSFLSSFPSPSSRKPASHRSCQSSVRPPSLPPHSSTTLLPQRPACGALRPEPCEVGLLSGLPGLQGSGARMTFHLTVAHPAWPSALLEPCPARSSSLRHLALPRS